MSEALETQKRIESRLEFRNGRPAFTLNGKPVSYAGYHDEANGATWICTPETWIEHCKDFVDSGVHVFSLQPDYSPGTTSIGSTPRSGRMTAFILILTPTRYFCVDSQAEGILKNRPGREIRCPFH